MNTYRGLLSLQRCLSRRLVTQAIRRPAAIPRLWRPTQPHPRPRQAPHFSTFTHRISAASEFADGAQLEEGFEEVDVELPSACPGCGVRLQLDDPDAPG